MSERDGKDKKDIRIRRSGIVVFDKLLAEKLGLSEAILFEYLMFQWTNRYLGKLIDGKWWLFFSATELKNNFPFLSRTVIYRTMRSLHNLPGKPGRFEDPLFEVGRFNRHKYDKTTWYTPTTQGINLYREIIQLSQYETGSSEFEKCYLKLRNAFYKIGVKIGKVPNSKTKQARSKME